MDALYNLAVIVSVVDRLTGPVKSIAQSVINLENTAAKAKGMIDFGNRMAVSGALVQGAADKTIGALKGLMGPVTDVQHSLGEVASEGVKDLGALQRAAEDFSSTWAGTTEAQFIASAYDIRAGISSLTDYAIAEYTRIAALTAKATIASADDMTSLFATGYGIFKSMYTNMSDVQFAEMFSGGIAGAVKTFKTRGPEMAQAFTTLGAAATSANRPLQEQLAILGMLQATMPGGEAGTKYKEFIKSAAPAGQTLGLNFTDSNNQLLGMVDILEKLKGKYGDTLDTMEKQQIQKAFGTEEAVAMIELLYPKIDQLKGNIDTMSQSMGQGTAVAEGMAQAMNTDLGSDMQLLGQNVNILKRSIGDELAPLLKDILPNVKDFVTSFMGFTKAHPTITRTALLLALLAAATLGILAPILTVSAGVVMMAGYFMWGLNQIGGGLLQVASVSKTTFKLLTTGFDLIKPGVTAAAQSILSFGRAAITTAVQAMPGLIASVWSFTAALLANPVTWIVVGIIALIAVIILLWHNWDKVTVALGKGWDWVAAKFNAGKKWFAGFFQGLVAAAKQYAPLILAVMFPIIGIPLLIAANWGRIKQITGQALTSAVGWIRAKAQEFMSAGQALIQAFITGIQNLINKPVEVVKNGLQWIRNLLPHSDAKEGPLSTLTYSGMMLMNTFAAGIQARAPHMQAVAAGAFGGINMPDAGSLGSWGSSPLGRAPSINMREVVRESTRESSYTRDRRPIVVVVKDQGGKSNSFESYIDMALRQLDMRG